MPNISCTNSVLIPSLYQGGLFILPTVQNSEELCNYATSIVEDIFESPIDEIEITGSITLQAFIDKAKKCKSTFTNDDKTKKLLRSLILDRYKLYSQHRFLYDLPRLRIVPTSSFLSSGISYNYKPHRDTWYGATQDQINHWMSLSNVTEESTFYIAPTYFTRSVENNSEIFDLDEWDLKYRPLAEQSAATENRPHPIPLVDIPNEDKYSIVIPRGSEVVFSAHHLHGSGSNTTSKVRFSIDYRVCLENQVYSPPENIDNRASGEYKKYMISV